MVMKFSFLLLHSIVLFDIINVMMRKEFDPFKVSIIYCTIRLDPNHRVE